MNFVPNSPRRLFRQLVDKAGMHSVIYSGKGKPGQYIKELTPEERKIIQNLKSDEVKNDTYLF